MPTPPPPPAFRLPLLCPCLLSLMVFRDGKAKSLVAYHEAGHALCATLMPGHDPVQKVTLMPRGQARGLTWFQPEEDPSLTKHQLQARIVGALGGRAAEEVIFGEPEVTSGAMGDLQRVTDMAKAMVTQFGMSEIGPWTLVCPPPPQALPRARIEKLCVWCSGPLLTTRHR